MADIRITKLAHLLTHYSLKIKKGDKFIITGSDLTLPLIKEVYREALKLGAHPETSISLPGLDEIFLKEGSEEQIAYLSPREELTLDTYDAFLFIRGEYNTRPLAGVDPKRISARQMARKGVKLRFMKRQAAGGLRWCLTQFPTHASAQEANMSLDEYEEHVYQAGLLDSEDPTRAWEKISEEQKKICDFLDTRKELQITSKNTNLRMSIAGRKWINCDGTLNFPDGEVFTTPIKDSVNGTIRFSYPAIHAGKEVEDIRLTFQDGKVIEATASKGADVLLALIDTDENSRYVGEIAIGTNHGIRTFTRNMLFDEKLGGTMHLALGMAFEETGGSNESAIHWDMLCEMKECGEIRVDGELIYQHGQFIREF